MDYNCETVKKELKVKEAINRMEKLGVNADIIVRFKNGDICCCEPMFCAYHTLSKAELAEIKKIESEYNVVAYCMIRSYTSCGVMDSYLYVSDYEEDWYLDNEDLSIGEALAYVYNRTTPSNSEFGIIAIDVTDDLILRRVY